MKRVAVYEHVSNGQGLKNWDLQKTMQYYCGIIEKHKDQDWQLYYCYIDRNDLGIPPRDRDVFVNMMIDAELGYFDLIIVHDMSMFSRSSEEVLKEVKEFRAGGVDVYFIEDNMWSNQIQKQIRR